MKSSQLVRFIAAYRDQPLKEKKPKIQERVQFSKTVGQNTCLVYLLQNFTPQNKKHSICNLLLKQVSSLIVF